MEVNNIPSTPLAPLVTEKWGYSQSQVINFSYTWTIDDFSLCKEKTREFIQSPEFSSGPNDEFKWCLRINPRGSFDEFKDYLSVWLRPLLMPNDASSKIFGKFKLSILNSKREQSNTRTRTKVQHFKQNKDYGFDKFVKRHLLLDEANYLLVEDRLTIFCEVSIVADTINFSGENRVAQYTIPKCKISKDFGDLLVNGKFSDVTLVVDGRELRAHKAILAARSKVLAAMCEHSEEEHGLNRIAVTGVGHEAIEEMLRFIYTGKATNVNKMAKDLLAAADKYGLENLKGMCEKALLSNLCVETAAETLTLAHFHSSDKLKTQTIDFIKIRLADVVDTSGWQKMIRTSTTDSKSLNDIIQTLTT